MWLWAADPQHRKSRPPRCFLQGTYLGPAGKLKLLLRDLRDKLFTLEGPKWKLSTQTQAYLDFAQALGGARSREQLVSGVHGYDTGVHAGERNVASSSYTKWKGRSVVAMQPAPRSFFEAVTRHVYAFDLPARMYVEFKVRPALPDRAARCPSDPGSGSRSAARSRKATPTPPPLGCAMRGGGGC